MNLSMWSANSTKRLRNCVRRAWLSAPSSAWHWRCVARARASEAGRSHHAPRLSTSKSLVFVELAKGRWRNALSSLMTPNGVCFSSHPMSSSAAAVAPRLVAARVVANIHGHLAVHAQAHFRFILAIAIKFARVPPNQLIRRQIPFGCIAARPARIL